MGLSSEEEAAGHGQLQAPFVDAIRYVNARTVAEEVADGALQGLRGAGPPVFT